MKLVAVLLVLLITACGSDRKTGLPDDARVPILLYHSWNVNQPCDYTFSDMQALQEDLLTLHTNGYRVIPLQMLIDWRTGKLPGKHMPPRPVVLTFDDGHDRDWMRYPSPCPDTPSVTEVLRRHGVHGTAFVIASPAMRHGLGDMTDSWWRDAKVSGVLDVQNHSTDHEHDSITAPLYDEVMGITLPVAAHDDGVWRGLADPSRIATEATADLFILAAGEHIADITGLAPTIYSHPYGIENEYLINDYLPNHRHRHGLHAAVCTERGREGRHATNMVTKRSPLYCLPRLTFGSSWRDPDGFLAVLRATETDDDNAL